MAAASQTLAPNWLFATQSKYDMDYVNGGCQGEPPAGTSVDDTFGTYASNYLVLAIGVAAAVALALNPRPSASYRLFASGFFALTGLGFGLAGLLHQVIQTEERYEELAWAHVVSYGLTLLGSLSLNVLVNQILFAKFETIGDVCRIILNTLAVLLSGGVALYLAIMGPNLILTGVTLLIVHLYALVVSAISCRWVQALAYTYMIAGMTVQVLLTPRCGEAGYPDCWANCPLPAPHFNHNALFHVLYAIGLLMLAIAMNVSPDITSKGSGFARLGTAPATATFA